MTDRVPINILANGAIKQNVYDADGNLLRTEYVKRDDGATVTGTPLNKGNLLSDATAEAIAAAYGITIPETVDAALDGMATPPIYSQLLSQTMVSNASSVSLDLSGISTSEYVSLIVCAKLFTDASSAGLYCTINNITPGYYGHYIASAGATVTAINNAASVWVAPTTNTTSDYSRGFPVRLEIANGYADIGAALGSQGYTQIDFSGGPTGSNKHFSGSAVVQTNVEITSIQFAVSSGNILIGSKFYVYGVKA